MLLPLPDLPTLPNDERFRSCDTPPRRDSDSQWSSTAIRQDRHELLRSATERDTHRPNLFGGGYSRRYDAYVLEIILRTINWGMHLDA